VQSRGRAPSAAIIASKKLPTARRARRDEIFRLGEIHIAARFDACGAFRGSTPFSIPRTSRGALVCHGLKNRQR